jgi:bifunctional UDP-N-acetylglucosamine pyrophosphorylase/glucosamine-1-phosphate N-acetyltransferase
MLAYVIDACRQAGVACCFVVVGYEKQQVVDAFRGDDDLVWVDQPEQKGTGHAVMMCRAHLHGRFAHTLVLCGDGPLIRVETLATLLARHRDSGAAATLATALLDDPAGYGRILRDAAGRLTAIVEERDCTAAQRAIREVNPSYYVFRTSDLFFALEHVRPDNAKGEYYVTDTLSILLQAGREVAAQTAVPAEDVLSINARADLARVNSVMRDRINRGLMEAGVTLVDPAACWIDARAQIGPDTVVHPFVTVGAARIGRGCDIGPFVRIPDGANLADGLVVRGGSAACGPGGMS